MKKILTYTLLVLTFSCTDSKKKDESKELQTEQKEIIVSEPEKTKETIFDIVFRKIEDVEYFKDFEKNSATVINYENSKWEYVFVEMQKQNNRIIVLEKIIETGEPKKKYQILDTIHVNNITEKEFVSIGVCQNNEKVDSRIFAIIERTENDFDLEYYSKIKKAWKANLDNKKIEKMSEINGITCMNEGYGI
ncbi:hypothetical protein [uncultured Lutibacter sp.]|uniref:hypothetical protein n=1 Tax=uncultured Lutibacter sp. TaxID=437739 RepID=UPI002626A150|nr:hypothetical protein [uncultured Lutibacter sp.]